MSECAQDSIQRLVKGQFGSTTRSSDERRRRRRRRRRQCWTFFKATENRFECLLTPDAAPSKGGTHLHQKYLSTAGEVSFSFFYIFFLCTLLCCCCVLNFICWFVVAKITNATRFRFERQTWPTDRHAKDMLHFKHLVGKGMASQASSWRLSTHRSQWLTWSPRW